MTTLYCRQGGLIEDPDWHWEVIGKTEGFTTKEVADNLALLDTEFAKNYDPITVTFYGWKLSIHAGAHVQDWE